MVAVAAVAVSAMGVAVAANSASTASENAQQGMALQKSASDKQYDLAKHQQDLADQQYSRYKTTFQPLEDQLVNESRDYGSNANRERSAATAEGDVTASYAGLRSQLNSTPGLDTSSAKYLDTMSRIGVQEAGQKAAAGTAARTTTDQIAGAKLSDAVSLGKNMPATSASILASSGNSLAGSANSANQISMNSQYALNNANQGLGGAWSGLGKAAGAANWGGAANTVSGWFNTDSQGWNPSASAANYGVGGMYMPTSNASFGGSVAGP